MNREKVTITDEELRALFYRPDTRVKQANSHKALLFVFCGLAVWIVLAIITWIAWEVYQ